MDVAMGEEFESICTALSSGGQGAHLRALVLTGEGKAFSAGGDLAFLKSRTEDLDANNIKIMRDFYRRFLSIRKVPVPVITAINGPAIGAGFALSLATDIRVTKKEAKLGLTFVSLGLHPGMGSTFFLPNLVGHQTASRLLLTGDVISGEEAAKLGLVELSDDPVSTAHLIAERIAKQNPRAVQLCTKTLRDNQESGLERALMNEAMCQAVNYKSGVSEGLAALLEKRAPEW